MCKGLSTPDKIDIFLQCFYENNSLLRLCFNGKY